MADTPRDDPDEAADAVRDAVALVRAALRDDSDGSTAVAENMSWPRTTAEILADLVARALTHCGGGEETLDAWLRSAGLS